MTNSNKLVQLPPEADPPTAEMKLMKLIILTIRILIVALAVFLFGWTVWQNLTPSGVLEARYDFEKVSPFITSLLPGDRALPITRDENNIAYQSVIGDPVYFRLRPPRKFDRASLEIKFQNDNQPIVEVGGLAARSPEIFDLEPLENKILDNLNWSKVTRDGLTLYQREHKFDSIQDFFNDLPARANIATYQASIETPFRIQGYAPTGSLYTIDMTLRGSHTFFAYVKNESIDVSFDVQDMNRDSGGDPISITVYNGTTPVGTINEIDDGITEARGAAREIHRLNLTIPGLPEGAYRIEFRSSRDIFIRKIETRSKKFVVANEIFIGDEAGYKENDRPVTLWTTGRVIRASTLHVDGSQELDIGSEMIRIVESHKEYIKRIDGQSPTRLYSPQGDIIIRTSGVFSFGQSALFAPEPNKLNTLTDLDAEDIDYVLAAYNPPVEIDGWKFAQADFDLNKLLWDGRVLTFVISSPYINLFQANVKIAGVKVRFEREPESVWSLLGKIWYRIKD